MATEDAFITFKGVKGESQDTDHKDWIDVFSWSWGLSNAGTASVGSGLGAGKAVVQDFHFTKPCDTSSADIAKNLLQGKHFDTAEMHLRKSTGQEKGLLYYKVKFEHVYITSFQLGGSGGGGTFTESVSFTFKKYYVEYQIQDNKGIAKPGGKYGWDVASMKEWAG
ncbi:Hcp family type VI secretion system effector [Prosthecomicrobium sp. N25]|uniref:Hcp family type VI secretion system effector n=1 Tax=Prosthecomicrobium sp. N25 TaxID=3129254 RepID=UPI0030781EBC